MKEYKNYNSLIKIIVLNYCNLLLAPHRIVLCKDQAIYYRLINWNIATILILHVNIKIWLIVSENGYRDMIF